MTSRSPHSKNRSRRKSLIIGVVAVAVTALSATLLFGPESMVTADEIGKVDTKFRFWTPDDTVRIEAFDDPVVSGVTCYLSRAKTGGIKGTMGLAEDTSDASIDCRQVGPITIKGKLKEGDKVFSERRSLIFKELQVVRYCDVARNTLVYLAYSDRVIEGSPKNSVSAVPIMPHGDQTAAVRCQQFFD
jgi:CreA protein